LTLLQSIASFEEEIFLSSSTSVCSLPCSKKFYILKIPWYLESNSQKENAFGECISLVLSAEVVFLLGIFRRAPCPSDTRGHPCAFSFPRGALPLKKKTLLVIYDTSSIREPPKVS
jgi:hypothetical protein